MNIADVLAILDAAIYNMDWKRQIMDYPGMIIVTDLQDRIVFVSEAVLTKYNTTYDDYIGKTDYEIAPPEVSVQDLDVLVEQIRYVKEKQVSCHFEHRLHYQNVYRYFEITLSPLINNLGHTVGVIRYINDVTDQKQLLEDIQRSRARYQGIVDNQHYIVIRFTPEDYRLTFANKYGLRVWNLSLQEALGRQTLDFVDNNMRDQVLAYYKTITMENPKNRILLKHTIDDHKIMVQWESRAIIEDDKIIEIQSAGYVMTEIYEMTQKMRRREEAMLSWLFKILSPSERICLLHLAGGMERKEIAQAMGCELSTIYKYIYRIRQKLHIEDLTELLRLIEAILSVDDAILL